MFQKFHVTELLQLINGPHVYSCVTEQTVPTKNLLQAWDIILIDNTDECTSNKAYAFTYNPLTLLHVSIC